MRQSTAVLGVARFSDEEVQSAGGRVGFDLPVPGLPVPLQKPATELAVVLFGQSLDLGLEFCQPVCGSHA